MKKQILTLALAGFATIALTGCGAEQSTISTPMKTNAKYHKIYVDVDTTAININPERVPKKNLRYTLALAATTAKAKGYKYFKIVQPKLFVQALKDNKVSNYKDILKMCDESEDRLYKRGVFMNIGSMFKKHGGINLKGNVYNDVMTGAKNVKYRCNAITMNLEMTKTFRWLENTIKGTTKHYPTQIIVEFTNEEKNDNQTFSVESIVNSEMFKDLDQDFVHPNKVK